MDITSDSSEFLAESTPWGLPVNFNWLARMAHVGPATTTTTPPTGTTSAPTKSPTTSPTKDPTAPPTSSPSKDPSAGPTATSTKSPTAGPTAAPSKGPTTGPTTTAREIRIKTGSSLMTSRWRANEMAHRPIYLDLYTIEVQILA